MPNRSALIRSRLGGRWAVSWQGYLLLFPVSVPLALLVVPAFATGSTWLIGFLVGCLAYGVTGLVLALAALTVLRNRLTTPAPVWLVVVVGGISWAVRSAVFAIALDLLDLQVETAVLQRVAVGFLLGALLVPGIAWLLASLDDFRLERQRLLDELVRQELLAEGSAAYLTVMRNDILDRVQAQVRSLARSAEEAAVGLAGEGASVRPEQLETLEQAVRATSHELAESTMVRAQRANRVTFGMVLQAAARRPFTLWPLPPYLLVGILFVGRFQPLTITVWAFVIAGVWAVLVTMLANAVCARAARPSVIRYGVFVVLMSVSGFVAGLLMDISDPDRVHVLLMITISVSMAIVMVAGGVAHAVNVAEEDVLADVRSWISEVEVRATTLAQEEARLRRELAIHLHGTVAANVTAAAMRLRQAIDEGNVIAAKAAYTEVHQLLDTDMRESLLIERADLEALLDELAVAWTGIAEVAVTTDSVRDLPPSTVRGVVDVVTEAVSNAVRHADARAITVSVSGRSDAVSVMVIDDGTGRSMDARGLGATLFDHVASRQWSLTPNGTSGSTLLLTIPRPTSLT